MPPSHSHYAPAPAADVLHLVEVVRAIVPDARLTLTLHGDRSWLSTAVIPVPGAPVSPVVITATATEWRITRGETAPIDRSPGWLAPEDPADLRDVIPAVLRFLDRCRCPQ